MLLERETLLDDLARMLAAAADGGRIALVGGEAGIGKTSLVAELAARRGEAGLWWGACDALQTPHPLAPLHDVARGGEFAFRRHLAGDAERADLFEAVLADLQAHRGALLFVVEDAHWADAATLDLLKFLGRRIEHTRCLLVVTWRDDEVDAAHPLRRLIGELPRARTTRLEVPPLSPQGVESLARRALRSSTGIHAATHGNPLFVTELLRHGSVGVPHGVRDLVLARLARLGAAAQDVVRLASVVPARIERHVVDRVLNPALETLEACFNSGLLRALPGALAFRHELARVAVEDSLSAPMAQALHARVLAAIADDASVSLARRVHHAARASDADAVARLAPAAAREAKRRGAHKEAAAQLQTALDHGSAPAPADRAILLEELSYECYLTDRIGEAIRAREAACALWRQLGDPLREGDALRWLSRLHWYDGRSEPAARYARLAIDALQAQPAGRELAMAYSNRAQLHMVGGESAAALEWGRKALDLSVALGDREIEAHALNNLGTAKLDSGDGGGRDELERSLALALAGNFEEHAARAYTNLAYLAVISREFDRAFELFDAGIDYCERHDLDSWARYLHAYRAAAWMARGDWDRAADAAQAVLLHPHAAAITRIAALSVLGRIRSRRGDPAAQALLDEALALARPAGGFMRIGMVAAAHAEAAWLRGDRAAVAAVTGLFDWNTMVRTHYQRWLSGEIAAWLHRAGALDMVPADCPAPFALEIAGRGREAAQAWDALGCPYEAALALGGGDVAMRREALGRFERLGASIDAERTRKSLAAAGVRGVPRGPRSSTRANPHGLTGREVEVLRLLCAGLRNAQIAERLSRSVRTVDHHLEAAFSKLGVSTRTEAMAAALGAGIGAQK